MMPSILLESGLLLKGKETQLQSALEETQQRLLTKRYNVYPPSCTRMQLQAAREHLDFAVFNSTTNVIQGC